VEQGQPDGLERPERPHRAERAERILDTAAALLIRWGYERVTIDDIASAADIGKGTIYLHWKTREALFQTLLLRETLAVWREIARRLRADPAEVLFSRMMRSLLLITMSRPIARALFTGDRELLGKLTRTGAGRALGSRRLLAAEAFLAPRRRQGLLRSDGDLLAQGYALQATVSGFFLIEGTSGGTAEDERPLSLEARAAALAETVRRAFEPADPPPTAALHAIARDMIEEMEHLCTACEQQMRALSRHSPEPPGT
jgi:AcrR family transcriptional regulator